MFGQMVENMLAFGQIIKCMERAISRSKTVENIQEIMLKIKKKATESSNGLTAKDILETGNKGSNMAMEYLL